MKVLVLAEEYSSDKRISQGFIHTRNLEYIKKNIEVDVISFKSTEEKYIYEKIPVYSLDGFLKNKDIQSYDIVVSHAPNIKHHCKFINKNYKKIKKMIFFFHGHEILYSKNIYPKPYSYMKKNNYFKESVRNLYDCFKIKYMKKFLYKVMSKSFYIFVSDWMYTEFKKNIKINLKNNKYEIIYNAIGEEFLNNKYNKSKNKKYDFITIRNMLDGSKYCIDVVNNIAKNNPDFVFLVIGKGKYFKYNEKAKNVKVINENLTHKEIVKYLGDSRYALMPTRADAQGVMMCEMAAYGIPLITSDIPVCHMVLGDVKNIYFISNDNSNINLNEITKIKKEGIDAKEKFSKNNTIEREIDTIYRYFNI